jgi:general secretion pathway protein F
VPVYRYKAATGSGEVVEGTLEANLRAQAVERLRERGLLPIRVDETARAERRLSIARGSRRGPRIRHEQILVFTRELATLLQAGLPLFQALTTLAMIAEDPAFVVVLERVRARIQQGASLADALEQEKGTFSGLYVSLVRAGEAGGALEGVLVGLAAHLERSKEVRDSVASALLYPAILLFASLVSVLLLLGYVVPQFMDLFEGMGQELPLPTRVTIAVGQFVQRYGWVFPVAVVGVILVARRALRDPRVRLFWDQRVLSLPLVGELVRKTEVARVSRTLGALLHNGVPLLKGLAIVRGTAGNEVIGRALEETAVRVKEGRNLAAPLAEAGCFPTFAVHMIRVGEESGRLDEMLTQVAQVYERDTQTTLKRLLTVLEPLLILVLGAIIAGIVMSILVAILGINEMVG